MNAVAWARSPGARLGAAIGLCLCLGLVGTMAVAEIALLGMRLPRTAAGRAWRVLGVTSMTAGLAAGSVGTVVLVAVDHAVAGPLVYGMLLTVPGAAVGALIGIVLWLGVYVRESRLL